MAKARFPSRIKRVPSPAGQRPQACLSVRRHLRFRGSLAVHPDTETESICTDVTPQTSAVTKLRDIRQQTTESLAPSLIVRIPTPTRQFLQLRLPGLRKRCLHSSLPLNPSTKPESIGQHLPKWDHAVAGRGDVCQQLPESHLPSFIDFVPTPPWQCLEPISSRLGDRWSCASLSGDPPTQPESSGRLVFGRHQTVPIRGGIFTQVPKRRVPSLVKSAPYPAR